VLLLQEQLATLESAAVAADNTGRCVAANETACRLTGHELPGLLRVQVMDLIPAARPHRVEDRWHRFIQAGSESGECLLKRNHAPPTLVRYMAYASVAPGVHLWLLTKIDAASLV
jgi:hypothetical protein